MKIFSDVSALAAAHLTAEQIVSVKTVGEYQIKASGSGITLANGNIAVPIASGTVITARHFGAVGDGSTDDTQALIAALNALTDNDVLDLGGYDYAVYNSVAGVTSGDAVALADTLRLANVSNITVQNGRIFVPNPSTSGTKFRFPSTFTVDGCTNIKIKNISFESKGESWGDTDASSGLSTEDRRTFTAQNGGHPFVVIRSRGVYVDDCQFIRCGSVGTFYSMSSDDVVVNNCYSSPMSLGYAAYAVDGWAGNTGVTGWDTHTVHFNNCRTDNNGATYGSKGGVVIEDTGTVVYVNGGEYKDIYANGASHDIGQAFMSSSSIMYVNGAVVDNAAAIGRSMNTTTEPTILEVSNVIGTNLRTSMHIQANQSFGNVTVRYSNCHATITGGGLWSETELSVSTVVANQKVTSNFKMDIENCVTTGAHTFSINSKACYGGIRVIGGHHTVTDRIFDSFGWGGASPNTGRGFEILGGAKFVVTEAVLDTSLTNANSFVIDIDNKDPNIVYTRQFIDIDPSVTIECTGGFHPVYAVITEGAGLDDRLYYGARLINCYQTLPEGLSGRVSRVEVISLDGLAGANVKVTLAPLDNKYLGTNEIYLIDDTGALREISTLHAATSVNASQLLLPYFIVGSAYNLTVGVTYMAFAK